MSNPLSVHILNALNDFIGAPTGANRDKLIFAADEYREKWIAARSSEISISGKRRSPSTSDRQLSVKRIVDGLPVMLALQERSLPNNQKSFWALSWRTKYSEGGSNRRFYRAKGEYWTIPARTALEMINELQELGGLSEQYFDCRDQPKTVQKMVTLAEVTGPDESWGSDPLIVVACDPDPDWWKVLIVDRDTGIATFRSITYRSSYMPKTKLRTGASWWLDNSMMDVGVQQMKTFREALVGKI